VPVQPGAPFVAMLIAEHTKSDEKEDLLNTYISKWYTAVKTHKSPGLFSNHTWAAFYYQYHCHLNSQNKKMLLNYIVSDSFASHSFGATSNLSFVREVYSWILYKIINRGHLLLGCAQKLSSCTLKSREGKAVIPSCPLPSVQASQKVCLHLYKTFPDQPRIIERVTDTIALMSRRLKLYYVYGPSEWASSAYGVIHLNGMHIIANLSIPDEERSPEEVQLQALAKSALDATLVRYGEVLMQGGLLTLSSRNYGPFPGPTYSLIHNYLRPFLNPKSPRAKRYFLGSGQPYASLSMGYTPQKEVTDYLVNKADTANRENSGVYVLGKLFPQFYRDKDEWGMMSYANNSLLGGGLLARNIIAILWSYSKKGSEGLAFGVPDDPVDDWDDINKQIAKDRQYLWGFTDKTRGVGSNIDGQQFLQEQNKLIWLADVTEMTETGTRGPHPPWGSHIALGRWQQLALKKHIQVKVVKEASTQQLLSGILTKNTKGQNVLLNGLFFEGERVCVAAISSHPFQVNVVKGYFGFLMDYIWGEVLFIAGGKNAQGCADFFKKIYPNELKKVNLSASVASDYSMSILEYSLTASVKKTLSTSGVSSQNGKFVIGALKWINTYKSQSLQCDARTDSSQKPYILECFIKRGLVAKKKHITIKSNVRAYYESDDFKSQIAVDSGVTKNVLMDLYLGGRQNADIHIEGKVTSDGKRMGWVVEKGYQSLVVRFENNIEMKNDYLPFNVNQEGKLNTVKYIKKNNSVKNNINLNMTYSNFIKQDTPTQKTDKQSIDCTFYLKVGNSTIPVLTSMKIGDKYRLQCTSSKPEAWKFVQQ
jgi:hypothetical protein